ncbi:MFS general substrate transporter [Russula compacta]|nr:MFS general substrate transporter [Russula compacta]
MGCYSRAEHCQSLPDSDFSVEAKSVSLPTLEPPAPHPNPDCAPDGGTLAWFQVAASFFVLMNTWGIFNTFGAYQNFYQVDLLRSHSPSAISWIGSIQGFLLLIVGVLTGPFFDAGPSAPSLPLVKQYYQAFLAQAVCIGIGAGMIFIPSIAVVSTYFDKRRSFAVGVSASGSSLGGVIFPIMFHSLRPRIGFGWTTRIIGLIALVTLGFANLVTRQRVLPTSRRKLFDVSALREAPFMLCTAGFFFGFLGLYIPFFYITPYALIKARTGATLAFYFVPILNAGSIVGRLIPNALADRIGALNMLIPCTLACGVLAFTWIAVHENGGLIAFAILYGFFSGAFVSLPPSTITSLSNDLSKVGTRLGMSFGICGIGVLIGSPVGGALLNLHTGHFLHAQLFGAVVMMISCGCLMLARVAVSGSTIMIKA